MTVRARMAQIDDFRQRLGKYGPLNYPPGHPYRPGPALAAAVAHAVWELDRDTYVVLRRRARWLWLWRAVRRRVGT